MDKFKYIIITFIAGALIIGGLFIYHKRDSKKNVFTNSYKSDLLPPAPTIETTLSSHRKKLLKEIFKGCNLTGDKKQLVDACNYKNTIVRNTTVRIAGHSPGNYNLGQVCEVFEHFYKNWNYVNDPKTVNYVEAASATIQNNFNGDCDDFAVLICSAILSIGGEARINYAYNLNSGHAFTEVNIGKTNKNEVVKYLRKRYNINSEIFGRYDKDQNWWLNLDWFADHPGGRYFDYTKGVTFYIIQNYCEKFN